jgi:hypothetical protein
MGETEEIKKKRIAIILQILAGGFLGFLGGYLLVNKLLFGDWNFARLILFLIFLIAGLFITTNVHEIGHLILGKINGYKLISYRIGFFALNKENGKIKFSIIKNEGYMGLCAMIAPEKKIPDLNHLLYYSGGVLFNILFGIVLIIIKSIINPHDLLNMVFIITAAISILLGVVNFIPFFSGNNPSDGKIMWSIILKKPFSKKLMEVNRLCAQFSAGKSLSELDIPFDFNIYQPDSLDITLLFYSYFKALDTDDDEMRSKYIKKMKQWINYIPGQLFPHTCYEICYNACIDGDREEAVEYYKKAEKILINDKDVNGLRVKAYYEYYVNKNINVSKFFCDSALEVVDKFPVRGQALIEEKLVKKLINIMGNN